MAEKGGERARKGFHYQDLATAYYFLKNEEADTVEIERHEDFSIQVPTEDPPQVHFYQAKTSKHGGMGWKKFKKILNGFYEVSSSWGDDDSVQRFHIVANFKPNEKVNSFLEDLEKLQTGQMQPQPFRNRWDERRLDIFVNNIKNNLTEGEEFNQDIFEKILSGLRFNFHTKGELESKIENFLHKCSHGRYTSAYRTIMNEISSRSSGGVSKRQIEKQIGFTLEIIDSSSTSYSNNRTFGGNSQSDDIIEVNNKYQDMDFDISGPRQDKNTVSDALDKVHPQSKAEEAKLEVAEIELKQGFDKAEKGLLQYQSAIQDIQSGMDSLFTIDSEGERFR